MTEVNKVLIVLSDLDPMLSRVYRNKLEKNSGWSALITSSYKEALDLIKKNKPKIVVSDLILEDGNGFDLLKDIRKSDDKDIAAVPVIILTELSQKNDRNLAKELGATKYLVKSDISLNQVIEEIKSVLN